MNNVTRYQENYRKIEEARAAVKEQEKALEERLRSRVLNLLWVAYRVAEKENRKKSLPSVTLPECSGIPVIWDRALERYTVREPSAITFHADHILVEWEWSQFGKKTERSFKFPISWLSASTWAMAKHVRVRIRAERDKLLQAEAKSRREEARKEWIRATEAVRKLTSEAEAFERNLDKLQRSEQKAKERYEELRGEAVTS